MPIEKDIFSHIALQHSKKKYATDESLSKRTTNTEQKKTNENNMKPQLLQSRNKSNKINASKYKNDLNSMSERESEIKTMENDSVMMENVLNSNEQINLMDNPEMNQAMMTMDLECKNVLENDPKSASLANNSEVLQYAIDEANKIQEINTSIDAIEKKKTKTEKNILSEYTKRETDTEQQKTCENNMTPQHLRNENKNNKINTTKWSDDLKSIEEWESEMKKMEDDPALMEQTLNADELASLMDDPEMIRAMMMSDPEFKTVLENDPDLASLLNNPEALQYAIEEANKSDEKNTSADVIEKKKMNTKKDISPKCTQQEEFSVLIPDNLSKLQLRNKIKGCIFGAVAGSALWIAQKSDSTLLSEKNENNVNSWSPAMNQFILLVDIILTLNGSIDIDCFSEKLGQNNNIDANTAVVRSIVIGLMFFWDIAIVILKARIQAKATHSDSRYYAASIAIAVVVATMLTKPNMHISVVVREAFEIAKHELGDNSEAVFRLHQHMFASSLLDLNLSEYGRTQDVEKAIGAGLTSLRTNVNELGGISKDMAVKMKPDELKLWNDHDALNEPNPTNEESNMNPQPFVIDLQKMSNNAEQFQLQLQEQMKAYQSQITQSFNLPEKQDSIITSDDGKSSLDSDCISFSTDDFMELLNGIVACGGSVDENVTITGALLGIRFGYDAILGKKMHTDWQHKHLIAQCNQIFQYLGI